MARTRSVRAHKNVLKATLRLISDRGIDMTSVDAIAASSGVSKATIYKHWRTKEELCLEAIGTVKCEIPVFDSADRRSDLIGLLQHFAQVRQSEVVQKLWPRIVGHAAGNPLFGIALRARFDQPRRAQVSSLVKKAILQGQLRADLDVDAAPDMLFGPIMYQLFSYARVAQDLPEKIVAAYWKANLPEASGATGTRSPKGRLTLVGKPSSR